MNPGDIYWVEFPSSGGHEQAGRRPAIVLQDEEYAGSLPLVIVVPLTGASFAIRFAGTLAIEPSESNHLRKTSIALVFQVRAVDRREVTDRIGTITKDQCVELYDLLDKLTGRKLLDIKAQL